MTLALFAAGVLLLVAFVVIELRTAHPLLPLRVVLDRNRGGSFLASLLVGVALLGTFLSLTYYFQGTLDYSAMKSGFAFVPFSIGIIAGATIAGRLLPRFGPRADHHRGLLLGGRRAVLFTQIGVHSAYVVTAAGRADHEPGHGHDVRRHEQHRPRRRATPRTPAWRARSSTAPSRPGGPWVPR